MLKKSSFCFIIIMSVLSFIFGEEERSQRRVYADIVGDLLHAGHLEFFKQAKQFGDYLIIGVLSDEDVESYKRVPILKLEERVAMVRGCRYVDEVIVAPPLRLTKEWITDHRIDYVVHGDDFNPELLFDQYGVSMEMGIFRLVPYTKGISSTEIIQRIIDREHPKKQ